MSEQDSVLTWEKIEAIARPLRRAQREQEGRLSGLYVRGRLAGQSHSEIERLLRLADAPDDAFRLIEGFRERWDRIEEMARDTP